MCVCANNIDYDSGNIVCCVSLISIVYMYIVQVVFQVSLADASPISYQMASVIIARLFDVLGDVYCVKLQGRV